MPLFFLFLGLLLIFIVGLGVLLGSMDVKNIQAEWDKRRCEPTIMFSAFLYKLSTDNRSSSTFATDNFSFCVRSLIDEVFKQLLAPVLGVFSQQMAAANTTNEILNSVRNQVGNTFRSFGGIFDDFFDTYKRGTMQLSRITQLLKQAMLKVSASVVSIVFLGISLMTSILNSYDFVVKVVIIIMSIIVSLIVLLFFALIPFMPIIFTTISVLTAAGLGSAVGGMAGAFCIDPDAKVLLENGETILLKYIKLGDKLGERCGTVTGILETDTIGSLYNVNGIVMSGSHMIKNPETKEFVFAEDYSGATPTSYKPKKLIILNTTSRQLPLLTPSHGTLIAKDWEEIPDNDLSGQLFWEMLVSKILNSEIVKPDSISEIAVISKLCKVITEEYGEIPIYSVVRGMKILDIDSKYTSVVGVYKGITTDKIIMSDAKYWFSSGVRIQTKTGQWEKIQASSKVELQEQLSSGYHLVTDSGTFIISCKGKNYKVRDFTEVGHFNIDTTYELIKHHLNKKKEIQQNSNTTCVSDFSLQA